MTYTNIPATSTPARNFPVDTISGNEFPRGKQVLGGEGVATEWLAGNGAAANGARVAMADEDRSLLGLTNSSAAADETATTGINGLLKGIFARLRGNLSTQLVAGTANIGDVDVLTVPTVASTTREYDIVNGARVAFTSTSTAATALPTLGASREVRLCASARCWIKWGTSGVSAAAAEAASFPVEANSPEVIRIPSSATHYRVIRDSADGNLTLTPAV